MLNISFSPFPVLETSRLQLRLMVNEDAPALFALRSDPLVMQHIGRAPARSMDDVYRLISNIDQLLFENAGINWAICLKEPAEMIGTICFWKVHKEHHRAELGYLLSPAHHRQGLMSEAMREVLRYGFEDMGLHSVEAHVAIENEASICLLKKCGFVQEAHFKESYLCEGKFVDDVVFCLLKSGFTSGA
jgi:ribosomal-protein-alanine N-acetyltransferase